jgi:hypothetical protein
MIRLAILLLLQCIVLSSTYARANDTSLAAGFECKARDNAIVLVYEYIPEEGREKFWANKPATMWDPWSLIVTRKKERIDSLNRASGQCQLGKESYTITIAPEPGNVDLQGRCGGHMGASATIAKDSKTVYAVQFESRECFDMSTPIVTRVIFKPGAKEPVITTVPSGRFRY